MEMIQVTDPAQIPIAIHGTNKEAWDHIGIHPSLCMLSFLCLRFIARCRIIFRHQNQRLRCVWFERVKSSPGSTACWPRGMQELYSKLDMRIIY